MTLTGQWPAAATDLVALRLLPGDDLRAAVAAAFAGTGATAGFVAAAVGSLTRAALRPAGREAALDLPGPLEIVALSGTLSPDGPHLHLAVADAGGRMTGGHLLPGCPVRTTAELVLAVTRASVFSRGRDARTGWHELFIAPPPDRSNS